MDHPGQPRRIRFGAFEVDLRSGEVRKHGIRLKLQEQPFRVLARLLERPGEVVTREELREELWPGNTLVDFDTGLNAAIKKLREALGDSAVEPRYVETLPRRGYRFIDSVNHVGPALPVSAQKTTVQGVPPSQSDNGADGPQIDENGSPDKPLPSEHDVAAWSATRPSPTPPAVVSKITAPGLRVAIVLGSTLAVLALSAIFLLTPRSASHNKLSPIRSLAVLPLDNLTGDPSQEYFADGMTEAIIAELAHVQGLKVISRTSVMHYKGAKKTLQVIARELGVDAIVEGAVARSGDDVKITAQLIRASTDTHLWGASYARSRRDLLRLQSDISRDVVLQISEQLVPPENKGTKPVVNPEAYDAYLKGLFFQNTQSGDGLRTAIRYFQQAIDKDPNFAAAYSRLSGCYAHLSFISEMPTNEAYQSAKSYAQKAVALDDELDQAHTALAWVAVSDWDWTTVEAEYRRAIQLNPNSVDAHIGYAYFLLIFGRLQEAAEHEQAARTADPLSPRTVSMSVSFAYHRRQYDDGLARARNALELYPQVSLFHVFLADFYHAKGEEEQSAQEILLSEEMSGAAPERLAALRAADKSGGPKGLRRARIELNKKVPPQRATTAYDIAIDCAAVGDGRQAIEYLNKALRARDPKIYLIGIEPIFDGIRSDPGFVALLRQMGLGPARS